MPLLSNSFNPIFVLIILFICVFGLAFLYAVFSELKNGRTGFLRVLMAACIVYGFADELGFNLNSPSSFSIVCSILFSAAWIVDVIRCREKSNDAVAKE